MADFISKVTLPDNNGYPIKASAIPYGEVDSTSTSTAFTATVPGIYELKDGVCVYLRNNTIDSADGFTININNLGAKPAYSNMADATRQTTLFNANSTMLFIYNENRIEDGCWDLYRGYSSNDSILDNNYVKKSGDTMTGDLFIEKTDSEAFMEFQRKDLNMRLGTTDASGSVGGFHYYDSNGDLVMYLESKLLTGDKTRAQLYARRTDASGTKYSHGFGIVIDGQGNGSVEFSSTAFRDAWANGLNVVKKAGDTMTGNLIARFSSFDLSKSNNNVSSTQYPTTVCIEDSAGRITTRIEGVVSSNGNVASYWYVRNYNTSGTQVAQKGIQMTMNKSGTLTYTVSDPANFRSAIGCAPANYLKGWTQIAQVQGTNSATYSLSGYTECLLMIWHGTDYFGTCVFPANSIGSTQYEMYTGGWGNKNTVSNRAGCAKVSNTKLTGVMVKVDNPDVTSSSYFRLYAR